MLDGLGLDETAPGPLFMVTQFVGFLGGGTFRALVTTWTRFTPCFLWIFLGGPFIGRLRGNEALTTTLSGVTGAVVGMVLIWASGSACT